MQVFNSDLTLDRGVTRLNTVSGTGKTFPSDDESGAYSGSLLSSDEGSYSRKAKSVEAFRIGGGNVNKKQYRLENNNQGKRGFSKEYTQDFLE